MPYIVKANLDVEDSIIPWNKIESEKLVKEKKEYFEKKEEPIEEPVEELKEETIEVVEEKIKKDNKKDKHKKKVGDK